MANEAQIQSGLRVLKRSGTITLMDYNARPSAFLATVTGTKGPLPGSVTASVSGTDVDFSGLTKPALCRLMNQDATNYVDVGIYEPATGTFYPLMELQPGETYVIRLSRNFAEEISGTVTGTGTVAENNRLRLRANTASVNVLVEAFEQ